MKFPLNLTKFMEFMTKKSKCKTENLLVTDHLDSLKL